MSIDVAVIGAGPAGMALAAALVHQGLNVRVVASDPEAAWIPNYAGWAHELPADWERWAAASWRRPGVRIDDTRSFALDRTYVSIDRARLQGHLREQVGDRCIRGEVAHLGPLTLTSGEVVQAQLVVDASGVRSPFVSRRSSSNFGYQVAYGEIIETDDPIEMWLMDYSGPEEPGPPSFLYTLPFGGGRCFVEETVLVGRPAPPIEVLRTRLNRRLDRMGIRRGVSIEVEHCVIPMGLSLPDFSGPLAWGAAAGLIHPATGYSMARSLREAPIVAAAIARGLASGPEKARELAWGAIWPAERQRAWAFYQFGMEAMIRMNLADTRAFFTGFFEHDVDTWAGWLAGELALASIPAAMTRHFGRVPWSVRASLVGTTMGRDGAQLVSRLLGMG